VRVCTVINKAWVAHARALAESLREHQPAARLTALIVDPFEGLLDPAQESFEIVGPHELDLEAFPAMSARYGVTELCCALKPAIIGHLLSSEEPVVYLDSDVRVFAPLEGLEDALAEHPFLLAPHLLHPLAQDGWEPDELAILLAGSHNLGFAAARRTDEVERLLAWWADRLRSGSRLDPASGLVFDQRWADLMPGMFAAAGLWRDPGVDFGYWRAANSRLERDGQRVLVDGHPLRCFHFSGYDPRQPKRLSMHDNRIDLGREPLLEELAEGFAQGLLAHGHEQASGWPYSFAQTHSGAELTPVLRALWDQAAEQGAVSEPPFTAAGERSFLAWLAEPQSVTGGPPLSRYLLALRAASPELRERYPDVAAADRERLLAWAREQAERRPTSVLGLMLASSSAPRAPGLRRLAPEETLAADRGETVVCIPVYGAKALFAECLTSVLEHTPTDVPILIADDASPDPEIAAFVQALADSDRLARHEVAYLRQPRNLGFPANVNAAFAAAAPADVVVLNSDCVVAAGWLEGMRRAAYSDAQIATASALTNHGTILTVPERNHPQPGLPQDKLLEDAAGAIRTQSLRVYPRLPTAVGHCMYVRRQALDLVGAFDLAFSPGYGEEVDFSQRCVLHGLVHVAADDVFVLHHSGGSFAEDGETNPAQEAHEEIIDARYPYYARTRTEAAQVESGPLPRALAAARRAIRGLSVTIDARCLGPFMTGTQLHTLEVIRGLERTRRVRLRVIVQPDIGAYARGQLEQLDGVEIIPHTAVHPAMEKSDIAHRPFQVSNANDLLILRCAGERTVITHQDLIAYRNPGYFPGYPQWERYRRLTRQALAAADAIVFFSHHAATDASREDLVEDDRIRVVYIGVDHASPQTPAARAPRGVEAIGERPTMLCLGTDFRHKNRVFALRMLEALRDVCEWDGALVLAGPRVSHGSSAGEEAAYLATRPELAARVIGLPAIGEPEKEWLLTRAAAVLYPTTYEGFGLMPFEAAVYGRPCLFASQTALAETLPADAATIVPWDARASAVRAHPLLSSPEAAAAHVRSIRQAGKRFTWRSAAETLVEVYWETAASPARPASRLALDLARVEVEREESERKYDELWKGLTPQARALLAPDSPLTPAATRSLAALVRRPVLRRMVLGPLQAAQRLRANGHDDPAAEGLTEAETFALHFAEANVEHMRELMAGQDGEQLIPDP
jgi:GT2 family glycosyltransferase